MAERNADIRKFANIEEDLSITVSRREGETQSLQDQLDKMGKNIAERKTERRDLNKKMAELSQKLRVLPDDVNLFSTEISHFVSQGGQNMGTYWKLAAVPIGYIIIVTGLLVFNAANLTTVLDESNSAKIWSILLTRIPFVVIATAIIAASNKLARVFIDEIMRINQQRLNLSKISMVATDVLNASQEAPNDLSDQ